MKAKEVKKILRITEEVLRDYKSEIKADRKGLSILTEFIIQRMTE